MTARRHKQPKAKAYERLRYTKIRCVLLVQKSQVETTSFVDQLKTPDISRLRDRLPSKVAWLALSGTVSPAEFPPISQGLASSSTPPQRLACWTSPGLSQSIWTILKRSKSLAGPPYWTLAHTPNPRVSWHEHCKIPATEPRCSSDW